MSRLVSTSTPLPAQYPYSDIRKPLTGMLILLLGLVSIDSRAESVPEFDATFTVRYGILRGEMTLKLSHEGDGYLYETSLRPRGVVGWFRNGSIDEQTRLTETGNTLRPLDYSSTDTIADLLDANAKRTYDVMQSIDIAREQLSHEHVARLQILAEQALANAIDSVNLANNWSISLIFIC